MSEDPGAPAGSAGGDSQEETEYTPVSNSAARAAAAIAITFGIVMLTFGGPTLHWSG
jgi:hypothetical protein